MQIPPLVGLPLFTILMLYISVHSPFSFSAFMSIGGTSIIQHIDALYACSFLFSVLCFSVSMLAAAFT
jgi:hypothetical protein